MVIKLIGSDGGNVWECMFVSISRKAWACITVGAVYLRDTGVKQMHSTAKLPTDSRDQAGQKQDKCECA